MAHQGVDLTAVDQDLDGVDHREIGSQGVHDRVHREQLLERAARVTECDLLAEVDEGIAALGQIQGEQPRAGRNR